MNNDSLEVRSVDELNEAFIEADNIIMKKYMNTITEYPIKQLETDIKQLDINSIVRLNKIEKIVYDSEENNQYKLMNIYNAVSMCGGSLINVIISDGKKVDYYLGVKSTDINHMAACQTALKGTFEGNFPGSAMTLQRKSDIGKCLKEMFGEESVNKNKIVSVVSGIPALRNEDNKEGAKFVQGIEKIIDSMKGQKYTIITISDPVAPNKILDIKSGYENLYTQLSPFATTSLTYSESDSDAVAETITNSITNTIGDSVSNTITNSTSSSIGSNKSFSKSVNITPYGIGASVNSTEGTSSNFTTQSGASRGETQNKSISDSNSQGKTDTYTNTNGRSLQLNIENKRVKNLLNKIDKQIERIENATDTGLWNTATYCIADDSQTSRILANSVEAICRGEKSTVENFSVGTWINMKDGQKVIEYLGKFHHPIIQMEAAKKVIDVNPTSLISGKELIIEAGLPQRSISGVPVSDMAAFARNIVTESEDSVTINLGKVYHMGKEESTLLNLQLESLSSHVLITGSTGSGKSNSVYQMLDELDKQHIKFLVVEPAKGEYKHVFGNRKDVKVYGTNDKLTELLKINPFYFPKSIHILEHIDRLGEIFNVCWPMYAAMPAVLKEAILLSYESCGWNLEESENCHSQKVFPTFKDLQREIINVINHSAYSEEVKGNYIGSLVTRVRSLTNGLNGKMFTNNAIEDEILFDHNVIVDLSRVGSLETKSLIMGLLVMKLNEYRMDQASSQMNHKLKHITVLEEAHHLLKNTRLSAGNSEGVDVAGKSVEMISNAIAEMRTYGEGFMIIDQSPSAIDISAIRNTNTKVIMRLPEEGDRQQAGKSAALKESQISELAKLQCGVAVVYQNNWLDPVLCKIKKAEVDESVYQYFKEDKKYTGQKETTLLLAFLMKERINEKLEYSIDNIEQALKTVSLSSRNRVLINQAIEQLKDNKQAELFNKTGFKTIAEIVVDILGCENKLSRFIRYGDNCELLQQELNREIENKVNEASVELKLALSQCIMREVVKDNEQHIDLYAKWREYAVKQCKMI